MPHRWLHIEAGQAVEALGGFEVIYVDPPWSYNDKGGNGAAENHYRTMSRESLLALPVERLAAPDCAMFMWGTYPLLPEMLALGAAWGFTYKTLAFQWVKRNRNNWRPFFGLGRFTRANTEGCFLFVRGKPQRVDKGVRQLVETFEDETIDAPIGRHSAKPPIVRERITQLMGADKSALEMFARERVEGWECWGNEVGSTIQLTEAA